MEEKLIIGKLTVSVLVGLSAVLMAFGTYVWKDITSDLEALKQTVGTLQSGVDEHDRSLLTIRQFLKVSNPELSKSFFSSIEKLKGLNQEEFNILKGQLRLVNEEGVEPFEMVFMKMKEIIEKHDIKEKDFDNYMAMGSQELDKLAGLLF